MNTFQKIAAMFGRQYIMFRASERLCFTIRHAYQIAGHWYVTDPLGKGHLMLVNSGRVTEIKDFNPGTMGYSGELWMPITNVVDAGVRMYGDDNGAAT